VFSLIYLSPSILAVLLDAEGLTAGVLLILQLMLYVLRPMGLALLVEWGALGAAISPYHVIREIFKVAREYTILWTFNIPMLAIELILSLVTLGAGNPLTATDGGKLVGG